MPCYYPQKAMRSSGGVVFVSNDSKLFNLTLPCGQCIGCRLERSRQWAMRCLHEASLHDVNAFVTLTYDDASVPPGGSLKYSDFQKFMKRLRKMFGSVTFYMGGEYGEKLQRPHYHACLFGLQFDDMVYYKKSGSGEKIYTSATLDKLWGHGLCTIGFVTFESAAYIARYCLKKVNGDLADKHYEVITDDGEIIRRESEFNHMSLKPAVGKRWLEKYKTSVFPRDFVVVRGTKMKPPKYYDRWFEKLDSEAFDKIRIQREADYVNRFWDDPNEFKPARLAVKEVVQAARVKFLRREL